MGYNTNFVGQLKFTKELTGSQLAKLKSMLGEDCREHPEWKTRDLYYVNLRLSEDFSGIEWNGSEKTYDLEKIVNVVIEQMQKQYPDFGLEGSLSAQGEDFDDRWTLVIEKGVAVKRKMIIKGQKIQCPHCDQYFIIEEAG